MSPSLLGCDPKLIHSMKLNTFRGRFGPKQHGPATRGQWQTQGKAPGRAKNSRPDARCPSQERKAEVDAERQRGRRSLPDRTALSASDARSLVAPFLVGVNPALNARIQGLLRGARSLDKSWDAVDEHMFGPGPRISTQYQAIEV